MKIGVNSLRTINKYYHEIRRKSQNLILYERNFDDDAIYFINARILLNVRDECYTYTRETIEHTITHSEDYKWFRLRK